MSHDQIRVELLARALEMSREHAVEHELLETRPERVERCARPWGDDAPCSLHLAVQRPPDAADSKADARLVLRSPGREACYAGPPACPGSSETRVQRRATAHVNHVAQCAQTAFEELWSPSGDPPTLAAGNSASARLARAREERDRWRALAAPRRVSPARSRQHRRWKLRSAPAPRCAVSSDEKPARTVATEETSALFPRYSRALEARRSPCLRVARA